jgi:hypothetical protein
VRPLNLKTRKHFRLDADTGEKVLLYIELVDENDKGISALFGGDDK